VHIGAGQLLGEHAAAVRIHCDAQLAPPFATRT
jgi:hypothetical protein